MNVRDDGHITGRHGQPKGAAGHGGWDASYYSLLRAGLLHVEAAQGAGTGSKSRSPITVTELGLARLDAEVRS